MPGKLHDIRKSSTRTSDRLEAEFELAYRLHTEGRFADAESLYKDIIKKNGRHFEALHFAGVIAFETSRTQEALALISKAVSVNKRYPAAICNLGVVLNSLGKYAEAIEQYNQAI